jgi:hypothetical protein
MSLNAILYPQTELEDSQKISVTRHFTKFFQSDTEGMTNNWNDILVQITGLIFLCSSS